MRYRTKVRKAPTVAESAELARLGKVLAAAERTQTEYASVIVAVRLLIFAGARLSEILELRWEQVDFDHACLRLPDSKTSAKIIGEARDFVRFHEVGWSLPLLS